MTDTVANKFVDVMSQPKLPPKVPTSLISLALGTPWRTVSKRVLDRPRMRLILDLLGWDYRPARGRRGGEFVRVGEDRRSDVERAMRQPWHKLSKTLLI
jgi:hypothetical protein